MESFTGYDASITAAILAGFMMIIMSFYLLYKGVLKLSGDKGAESSIEFTKNLRFTTHYPALVLFALGVGLIAYPLFLTNKDIAKPIVVQMKVLIEPAEEISDVRVRVVSLGPTGEESPDYDGSFSWVFTPALQKVRLEILAPGRKAIYKTAALKAGAPVDAGTVKVPNPLVKLQNITVDTIP